MMRDSLAGVGLNKVLGCPFTEMGPCQSHSFEAIRRRFVILAHDKSFGIGYGFSLMSKVIKTPNMR